MKQQQLKLQLKSHALFLLYTYIFFNNNLALQVTIFLKRRLLFYNILLPGLTLDTYCMLCQQAMHFVTLFDIFTLHIRQTCKLFRELLSSNCPKFTIVMSFFVNTARMPCPPKICLDYLFICYQNVTCEETNCVNIRRNNFFQDLSDIFGKMLLQKNSARKGLC